MNYLSQSKHPLIKFKGHEKIGNDHHLRRLSIVKQILLVSSIRNVQRTVWRICILMLGCKGLRQTFALNVISACSVTASFSLDIALSAHFVFIYNSQQTFILWRLISHFDRQKAKCSVYWIQVRNLQWSRMLVFNLRSHWLFGVPSLLLIGR